MQSLNLKDSFKFIGEVKWQKFKAGTKELIAESQWMQNKVMANEARGVYQMLDHMVGDTTYELEITHADIGDDNTAPAATDTDLTNGLVRGQLGLASRSGATASFRFFYPDALTPDDTYVEFGMFADGTASLGTGRLFNHLVFSEDLVKATGEDVSIICRITATV